MATHPWFAALVLSLTASVTFPAPARAALVMSVPDMSANPGSLAFFDVLLTNLDATAVEIGGFTIDVGVDAAAGMEFTNVATSPTSQPYIFAGTGAVDAAGIPFSFDVFPNSTFTATDVGLTVSGRTLNPHETLSLGQVAFIVASNAIPGRVLPVTIGSLSAISSAQGSPIPFTTDNGSITIDAAVPEPASLGIWAIGALLAGSRLRRRQ